MKLQATPIALRKQTPILTWVVISALSVAASCLFAEVAWESGDEWRGQYKVGDKVQFTISGDPSDYQICTVSENDPHAVMRVRCETFKQWTSGTYIVHSQGDIRPVENGGSRNKPSSDAPVANLGSSEKSEAEKRARAAVESPGGITAQPSTTSAQSAINLAGTYWALLSMTKKGQEPKDSSAPPDVEFCKNGEWGILHYGGTREAGNYSFSGGRLEMRYEGGELYGNFAVTREGNLLILDDGEYVLRLRYVSQVEC